MGVVAEITDRVAVMYAGKIVELASTAEIFRNALHPYTSGLLKAIPRLEQKDDEKLYMIEGTVPPLGQRVKGCAFSNRCEFACERCREAAPPMMERENGHKVSCWLFAGKEEPGEEGQENAR